MKLIAYYEGTDQTKVWLETILGRSDIEFRKLPSQNISTAFTKLPAYISDILYLDKPDVVLAGSLDGRHERPIFSIEFASCTPQYQHALQRFSRMMASVVNSCPSVIIMPERKRENDGGVRLYKRSQSIEYGAVRLMDIYRTPAFVMDWPDDDGILKNEAQTGLPLLNCDSMRHLRQLLKDSIAQFYNVDYIGALWRLPIVKSLVDITRMRAYDNGAPSISRPGGGQGAKSKSNLDLFPTNKLISEIENKSQSHKAQIKKISDFIKNRQKSLVFYPTRVTKHAGDPYVGMIGYYDIAFCRTGPTTRDRGYNLVAHCKGVSIDEINKSMTGFYEKKCPFSEDASTGDLERYSYHLKYGCKLTKSKPSRIYAELADLVIFDDGLLYNVG